MLPAPSNRPAAFPIGPSDKVARRPAVRGRKVRRLVTLTAVALLLAGCSFLQPQQGYRDDVVGGSVFEAAKDVREHVESGETIVLRLSYHNTSRAFVEPISQGIARAAREFGVDAKLIGPRDGDPAKQVAELEQLITQRAVQGLAVSSSSPDDLKPTLAHAYDEGIPLISFNTNNPGSRQLGFVGQDLYESGRFLAQQILKALRGRTGKVVVFSMDAEAGWSADRWAGFQSVFQDRPGFQVVEQPVTTGPNRGRAAQIVQQTMARQGQGVVAIAAMDCCSLNVIGDWVERAGTAGETVVMGYDVLPETVEQIQSGAVTGTISSNPAAQGYNAVKVLVEFLRDGKEIADVDTGNTLVTKANVGKVPAEG